MKGLLSFLLIVTTYASTHLEFNRWSLFVNSDETKVQIDYDCLYPASVYEESLRLCNERFKECTLVIGRVEREKERKAHEQYVKDKKARCEKCMPLLETYWTALRTKHEHDDSLWWFQSPYERYAADVEIAGNSLCPNFSPLPCQQHVYEHPLLYNPEFEKDYVIIKR